MPKHHRRKNQSKPKPTVVAYPQWQTRWTFFECDDANKETDEIFCVVLVIVADTGVKNFGHSLIRPDHKTIEITLNIQDAGVRSAALAGDQDQLKDFASVAWWIAATDHKLKHGDWPWPSKSDLWPEFAHLGRKPRAGSRR